MSALGERQVWLYRPAAAAPAAGYGWALFFDGDAYRYLPTPHILDWLIGSGRTPPIAAIFLGGPRPFSQAARSRDLSCTPATVSYLTDELLPWTRRLLPLSADPAQAIVGGASYGGLAAAHAALVRPDVWGNVLAQSRGFLCSQGLHRPADPQDDGAGPSWLIRHGCRPRLMQGRDLQGIGPHPFDKLRAGPQPLSQPARRPAMAWGRSRSASQCGICHSPFSP